MQVPKNIFEQAEQVQAKEIARKAAVKERLAQEAAKEASDEKKRLERKAAAASGGGKQKSSKPKKAGAKVGKPVEQAMSEIKWDDVGNVSPPLGTANAHFSSSCTCACVPGCTTLCGRGRRAIRVEI